MLLDDGLAEHLLILLCSRWNTHLEEVVQEQGKFNEMKVNIQVLMRHMGENENKIKNTMSKHTINKMLSSAYATGTEKN